MTQGYTKGVPVDTDGTLSLNSNALVPSQAAVVTYVGAQIAASSAVTSVTGTANRITSTGGTTPVIDIAATYVGQTSLTTLGTITTGTWNGTDIAVADGGTGRSSHTEYAVICGGTTATGAQQSIASVGTATHVLTSNGAGTLPTFQAITGGGLAWTEVTGTTQAAAVNNGYICNNAGLVTVTLPGTAAIGDIVAIGGSGAGLWALAATAGDTIQFGNQPTSSGGTVTATHRYDAIEVICITANTTWIVLNSVGNFTIA